MRKALKKNFIKFTGRLGFGTQKNDNLDENVVDEKVISEEPIIAIDEIILLENNEFNQRIESFKAYLSSCIYQDNEDILINNLLNDKTRRDSNQPNLSTRRRKDSNNIISSDEEEELIEAEESSSGAGIINGQFPRSSSNYEILFDPEMLDSFDNYDNYLNSAGGGGNNSKYNTINSRDGDDENFLNFIRQQQIQRTNINLPNDLIHSIFLSILSNSNMLIDQTSFTIKLKGNSNNKSKRLSSTPSTYDLKGNKLKKEQQQQQNQQQNQQQHFSTGYILSKIIPLMCGLKCGYISCSSNTTSEELVKQLFLRLPQKKNNKDIYKQQQQQQQHSIQQQNSLLQLSQTAFIPKINNNNNDNSLSRSTSNASSAYQQSNTPPLKSGGSDQQLQQQQQQQNKNIEKLKKQQQPININNSYQNQIHINSTSSIKDYEMVDILIVDDIDYAPLSTRYTLLQMMTYRKVAYKGSTFNTPKNFNIISTININSNNNNNNFNSNFTNFNNLNINNTINNNNNSSNNNSEPMSPLILDHFLLNYKLTERLYIPKLLLPTSSRNSYDHPQPLSQQQPIIQPHQFILTPNRIKSLREQYLSKTYISNDIDQYIRSIIINLRNHPFVSFGPSPRATPIFILAAKSLALLSGKNFVTPTHILKIATQVLNHRIFLFNPFSSIDNNNNNNSNNDYNSIYNNFNNDNSNHINSNNNNRLSSKLNSKQHHHQHQYHHSDDDDFRSPSPLNIISPPNFYENPNNTSTFGNNNNNSTPTINITSEIPISGFKSLKEATLLPPPPIEVTGINMLSPLSINGFDSNNNRKSTSKVNFEDQQYNNKNNNNNNDYDSFQIIKIILENIPSPL